MFPSSCSYCKKTRDDTGYREQVEVYLRDHSEVEFSHGICPDCMQEHYPLLCEGGHDGAGKGAP